MEVDLSKKIMIGSGIKFSKIILDQWVGDKPLCTLFLHLYHLFDTRLHSTHPVTMFFFIIWERCHFGPQVLSLDSIWFLMFQNITLLSMSFEFQLDLVSRFQNVILLPMSFEFNFHLVPSFQYFTLLPSNYTVKLTFS